MEYTTTISIIISLVVGVFIGRYLLQMLFKKQEQSANDKAAQIVKDAEQQAEHIKKQRQLEAKEKFLQLKAEHEKEVNQKKQYNLSEGEYYPSKRTVIESKIGKSKP
jgi:ribonuclease Y